MKKSEQLKKILTDIATKVPDDVKSEVDSLIGNATSLIDDIGSTLATFASENENYRKSTRETASKIKEYETKIKNLEDDLETAKSSVNTEELEALREYKANTLKAQKDGFVQRFQDVSKHKNWELAKGQFKLPEPNDKGEYDFTDMSEEDLEYNVNTMRQLDTLQYFGEQKKVDSHGKNSGTGGGKDFTEIVREAKTEKELMEIAEGLNG